MRRWMTSVMLFAGLAGAASAQMPLSGTVVQMVPTGVYLQNTQGVTFLPSVSANFRVGNTPINISALGVGRPVQAYVAPSYAPQYIPFEYYQAHPQWDWNHHLEGWHRDRESWHHDNGNHYGEYKHGKGNGNGNGHGNGKKNKKNGNGHHDD